MLLVGGAWPLLVTLTPAADRPWISGTSDNSIWSLIFGYNGLGRVAGQTGGPGGAGGPGGGFGGGSMFGGSTGPLRLLNRASAGRRAGCSASPPSRPSPSSSSRGCAGAIPAPAGWCVVGGSLAVPAVVFSFAQGIFHPYYVSFLAPFAAALVGAGVALALPASLGGTATGRWPRLSARWPSPPGRAPSSPSWATRTAPLALGRPRASLVAVALAVVLAFSCRRALAWPSLPSRWPACSPRPRPGRRRRSGTPRAGPSRPAARPARRWVDRAGSAVAGGSLPGRPVRAVRAVRRAGAPARFGPFGRRGERLRRLGQLFTPRPGGLAGPGGPSGPPAAGCRRGGFAGGGFRQQRQTLQAAISYARAHGGGTIGVESQSQAATAIVSSGPTWPGSAGSRAARARSR